MHLIMRAANIASSPTWSYHQNQLFLHHLVIRPSKAYPSAGDLCKLNPRQIFPRSTMLLFTRVVIQMQIFSCSCILCFVLEISGHGISYFHKSWSCCFSHDLISSPDEWRWVLLLPLGMLIVELLLYYYNLSECQRKELKARQLELLLCVNFTFFIFLSLALPLPSGAGRLRPFIKKKKFLGQILLLFNITITTHPLQYDDDVMALTVLLADIIPLLVMPLLNDWVTKWLSTSNPSKII